MAIADLISEIENAAGPSRELDAQIALSCGWQRRVETRDDSRTVVWSFAGEDGRLPAFTFSVDAALELLESVAPNSHGGVSWISSHKGVTCTAKVNEEPYCHAATPALAICAVALKVRDAELKDV